MDLDLKGKLVIVTGGSRGTGKAVARQLAREGVNIAIAVRDQPALERTAKELAYEIGVVVVPLSYDAATDTSVREMVTRQPLRSAASISLSTQRRDPTSHPVRRSTRLTTTPSSPTSTSR